MLKKPHLNQAIPGFLTMSPEESRQAIKAKWKNKSSKN